MTSHPPRWALPLWAACLWASPLSAQAPAKVKIEAQIVAPYDRQSSGLYTISPHGGHIGVVVNKGSRVAVSIDGVVGPPVDDILAIGGRGEKVAFSSDGTRHAYLAKLGQEVLFIVDGKEVLRRPAAISNFSLGTGDFNPGFTANGKHSYLLVQTGGAGVEASQQGNKLYLDGVPGPNSRTLPRPSFSPDGSHVAYVVVNPANPEQSALVLDGKLAGYPPPGMPVLVDANNQPTFTADGAHLFVAAMLPRSAGVQLFVDGRPFLKAPDAHPFMAPTGNGFVTRISQSGPSGPVQFIDVAGKRIPASDGQSIDTVYFSGDGTHWAARVRTPTNTQFIIADGKKGLDYQTVGDVGFTADGRAVYQAATTRGQLVVVGDQESNLFQHIQPQSGPTGTRYYAIGGNRVGFIANSPQGLVAVVDSKAVTNRKVFGLDFSPDGSRVAFATGEGLNVDGNVVPGGEPTPFTRAPKAHQIERGTFLFSPDSKHLVHFGAPAGGNQFGIFVNGKFLAAGNGQPYHPTFTPDGRHLFWMDTISGESKFAVYLDGQLITKLDFVVQMTGHRNWWEMGSDGVLTLAAIADGNLQRIRITPGTDTSIETMLSKMGPPR